jgi:hypothetical protein
MPTCSALLFQQFSGVRMLPFRAKSAELVEARNYTVKPFTILDSPFNSASFLTLHISTNQLQPLVLNIFCI